MASAVVFDMQPFDLIVRWRTVANVLSIGFESLSGESLASVGKDFNAPGRFAEDIERLRARGIQVIALIIVGLDGDGPETFAATLRWLEENDLPKTVESLDVKTLQRYYDDLAERPAMRSGWRRPARTSRRRWARR
mgnify:CR=1 FL=1